MPGSSVGRAGAPYTEAVSSLQWTRVRFHLWHFAACHSPSLSPVSCLLFSCPVHKIKAQKISLKYKTSHPSTGTLLKARKCRTTVTHRTDNNCFLVSVNKVFFYLRKQYPTACLKLHLSVSSHERQASFYSADYDAAEINMSCVLWPKEQRQKLGQQEQFQLNIVPMWSGKDSASFRKSVSNI